MHIRHLSDAEYEVSGLVTQAGFEYDGPQLARECSRNGLCPPANRLLDTKVLFTYAFPWIDATPSTDFMIRFFGIASGGLRRHDALGDAMLIDRIFGCLLHTFKERGISTINISKPLRVKKVQLKPLSQSADH